MIEWTDVDPQVFETYPSPKSLKGLDDIDAVIQAIAAGKTVEMTLADASAVRGRRMVLGRRAKQRGLVLDMRYQGTKIIVRQKTVVDGTPDEPSTTEPEAEPEAEPQSTSTRGSRRKRS